MTDTTLMTSVLPGVASPEDAERAKAIRDHYALVAPLLIKTFGHIPLVGVAYPHGLHKDADYVQFAPKNAFDKLTHVVVHTRSGRHNYVALAENSIDWLLDAHQVVELHSWAPSAHYPTRPAFGRILIEPHTFKSSTRLPEACTAVAATLAKHELKSALCLGGLVGAQVWIPFADAPDYPTLRAWLHALAKEAIEANPQLLTDLPKAERNDRAYLNVSVNAVGRFAALPFSLRAREPLTIVTPITWAELGAVTQTRFTAANVQQRLQQAGDVFAAELARIGAQHFPVPRQNVAVEIQLDRRDLPIGLQRPPIAPGCAERRPRGYIIEAVLAALEDGQPRSAEEILAVGQHEGSLPDDVTSKYVYNAIESYIGHLKLRDRRPPIVQNPDRRFRLNHAFDDWPFEPPTDDAHKPNAAASDPKTKSLVERLRSTATGAEPAQFEQAVCDALEALGFLATHVGGNHAPDGYADAPLGPLGYRVMIECKTAKKGGYVTDPSVYEAAKYKDAYGAQCCMLIGPAFGESTEIDNELKTHGVSLWTTEDLVEALNAPLDPLTMRKTAFLLARTPCSRSAAQTIR